MQLTEREERIYADGIALGRRRAAEESETDAPLHKALEEILVSLGRAGANADVRHSGREAWEIARRAIFGKT